MSKYKGQHGGKKGKKIRARPPPLFSGNARKKSIFLYEVFPYSFTPFSFSQFISIYFFLCVCIKKLAFLQIVHNAFPVVPLDSCNMNRLTIDFH